MEQECAGVPQARRRMRSFRGLGEDPERQRFPAFLRGYITAIQL